MKNSTLIPKPIKLLKRAPSAPPKKNIIKVDKPSNIILSNNKRSETPKTNKINVKPLKNITQIFEKLNNELLNKKILNKTNYIKLQTEVKKLQNLGNRIINLGIIDNQIKSNLPLKFWEQLNLFFENIIKIIN